MTAVKRFKVQYRILYVGYMQATLGFFTIRLQTTAIVCQMNTLSDIAVLCVN